MNFIKRVNKFKSPGVGRLSCLTLSVDGRHLNSHRVMGEEDGSTSLTLSAVILTLLF